LEDIIAIIVLVGVVLIAIRYGTPWVTRTVAINWYAVKREHYQELLRKQEVDS
jgi:hypothetical protein